MEGAMTVGLTVLTLHSILSWKLESGTVEYSYCGLAFWY